MIGPNEGVWLSVDFRTSRQDWPLLRSPPRKCSILAPFQERGCMLVLASVIVADFMAVTNPIEEEAVEVDARGPPCLERHDNIL